MEEHSIAELDQVGGGFGQTVGIVATAVMNSKTLASAAGAVAGAIGAALGAVAVNKLLS